MGTTLAATKPRPTEGLNDALIHWARASLDVLASPRSRWSSALTYRGHAVGELCFEECFLQAQPAMEGVAVAAPVRSLRALPARVVRAVGRRIRERAAPLRGGPPGRVDVVFHAVEPTHLSQQVPVAAALARRASVCFVTPRGLLVHALAKAGFRPVLAQSAWADVATAGRDGARALEVLHGSPAVDLPPPPQGEPAALLAGLRSALRSTLPSAYEAARAAERVMEEMRPKLVVVGNDLTVGGRALARVARAAGVPSACIMHGTVLDPLHRHHVVDRLLVYGDAHRRHLVDRQGIEAGRIAVTGAPYLDQLERQKREVDRRLQRKLGLGPRQPFVVMAVSNPANMVTLQQHERTIRAVMGLSTRLRMPLVARLHRGDSPAHYERLAREVPGQRLVVVRNDAPGWPGTILDWLQGCSLLLTGASTVALEAMLLDVPVVTMDFTGDYADVDFIKARATEHVTDEVALVRAATALVADPASAAALRTRAAGFLGDYFYRVDRGASQRCADALVELMRSPCAA